MHICGSRAFFGPSHRLPIAHIAHSARTISLFTFSYANPEPFSFLFIYYNISSFLCHVIRCIFFSLSSAPFSYFSYRALFTIFVSMNCRCCLLLNHNSWYYTGKSLILFCYAVAVGTRSISTTFSKKIVHHISLYKGIVDILGLTFNPLPPASHL